MKPPLQSPARSPIHATDARLTNSRVITLAASESATILLSLLLLLAGRANGAPAATATTSTPSCPATQTAGRHDYHGLALTGCNFNGIELAHADFRGATLTGVNFIKADLHAADFSGATFADSGNPAFPNDFSFAKLDAAKFAGAQFNGPTYFTYASLPCADFSQTVLNTGNAIFGDQPIAIDTKESCRTTFTGATMNCEFVPQWNQLDMTGANIGACAVQLQTAVGKRGFDFSGGRFSQVVFDNLDLTGSAWSGAVLEHASFQGATLDNATGLSGTASQASRLSGAKFNSASLRNVDLSNAQLYGAQFTHADLSNSSLQGSFLTDNTKALPPIETAATFDGAHLKNVNLSGAQLRSVSFRYASFYGSFGGAAPTFPCTTTCATASGADLTATNFSNAYLYGVDFTKSSVNGTLFGSAILTGANFTGAKFQVYRGAAPDFSKALLQGATFDAKADLVDTSFLDAFVDFGAPGNLNKFNFLNLQLSADYTQFRGWSGSSTPCVATLYSSFSAVPATATMTCPDAISAVCGAGKSADSLAHWKSRIAMAANSPVPGWYVNDATYDKASVTQSTCGNNASVDPTW